MLSPSLIGLINLQTGMHGIYTFEMAHNYVLQDVSLMSITDSHSYEKRVYDDEQC